MNELIVALQAAVRARRKAHLELDDIPWKDHALRHNALRHVERLMDAERAARKALDTYIEEACR